MENTKNKKYSTSQYIGIGILVVIIIIAIYILSSGRDLDDMHKIPDQGQMSVLNAHLILPLLRKQYIYHTTRG